MDFSKLRELNLRETKKKVRESVTLDFLIIQLIHTIDELIKISNRLLENIRERYTYYSINISKEENIPKFLKLVKAKTIDKELAVDNKEDFESILSLVSLYENIAQTQSQHEKVLTSIMNKLCPRLTKEAGVLIGARLIALGKGLKHLAELPSSTIQILGSEKALFRHLKTGAKPPRFGVLFAHPKIQSVERELQGKTARKLAAKISIAVKMDYYSKER